MGVGRIIGNPVAPKQVYAQKQKKDAEASSFNVAGTGLEPVSAAEDMSPKTII